MTNLWVRLGKNYYTPIDVDICCFNRPFDDQNQTRVRFETEAKLERKHSVPSPPAPLPPAGEGSEWLRWALGQGDKPDCVIRD